MSTRSFDRPQPLNPLIKPSNPIVPSTQPHTHTPGASDSTGHTIKSTWKRLERESDPTQQIDAPGAQPPIDGLEDVREGLLKRLTVNPNSTVPGAIHRHIITIVKGGDFEGATKLRIAPESLPQTRKNHCYDGNHLFVVLM